MYIVPDRGEYRLLVEIYKVVGHLFFIGACVNKVKMNVLHLEERNQQTQRVVDFMKMNIF